MSYRLTPAEIRRLGFEWPRYPLLEQEAISEAGQIDLVQTLEVLEHSRRFYRKQLNDAFAFKQATGADYSDFTDRHDEYATRFHELRQAIAHLQTIIAAVEQGSSG